MGERRIPGRRKPLHEGPQLPTGGQVRGTRRIAICDTFIRPSCIPLNSPMEYSTLFASPSRLALHESSEDRQRHRLRPGS
jgi:hypothetical protein